MLGGDWGRKAQEEAGSKEEKSPRSHQTREGSGGKDDDDDERERRGASRPMQARRVANNPECDKNQADEARKSNTRRKGGKTIPL